MTLTAQTHTQKYVSKSTTNSETYISTQHSLYNKHARLTVLFAEYKLPVTCGSDETLF